MKKIGFKKQLALLTLVFVCFGTVVHAETVSDPVSCMKYSATGETPVSFCSEETVVEHSKGNHELNCTVIRPWSVKGRTKQKTPKTGYPIIIWANGWGWNDIAGETTTNGYKPGLIEWSLAGPYIVVAANQWSVQESDILRCLKWIGDQNNNKSSDYYQKLNTDKIGLAGHSQGGGAVVKAGGDGALIGYPITATIPMNPFGPAWVRSGSQEGPMLLLGGALDTTTPPESYQAVWDAVATNDIGGINAILHQGTHNSEAWGVDSYGETMDNEQAQTVNFGVYKEISELWWAYFLNGHEDSLSVLTDFLSNESLWQTESSCTEELPCIEP
jgi:hypothetical protein